MEDLILKINDHSKNLLSLIGFEGDPEVTSSDNVIFVNINLDSPALLIGKGGEGLDAFQHVLRSMLGAELAQYDKKIVIDIAGYRDKKTESTKRYAKEKALSALATGMEIELIPMSSFDRRIVHMIISEISDVESESVGAGRERRIVIKPKKNAK